MRQIFSWLVVVLKYLSVTDCECHRNTKKRGTWRNVRARGSTFAKQHNEAASSAAAARLPCVRRWRQKWCTQPASWGVCAARSGSSGNRVVRHDEESPLKPGPSRPDDWQGCLWPAALARRWADSYCCCCSSVCFLETLLFILPAHLGVFFVFDSLYSHLLLILHRLILVSPLSAPPPPTSATAVCCFMLVLLISRSFAWAWWWH